MYAGLHFFQKKYGEYDRKNYNLINNFFSRINKQTSLKETINFLNDKNKI